MQRRTFNYFVLPAVLLCGYAIAQHSQPNVFATEDNLARSSRTGTSTATVELTRQMFRRVSIPSDLADGLGFTDRLVAAETAYTHGEQAGVKEQQIVTAINNLSATIGAPVWTKTSSAEVRKLRVRMLTTLPHLVGYQGAADANGKYKALPEVMSPVEAAYITTHLLYQKAWNAEYQLSADEQANLSQVDALALHTRRTQDLQDLLQGRTKSLSVRDLLSASDRLFEDLNIAPTPATGLVASIERKLQVKGAR